MKRTPLFIFSLVLLLVATLMPGNGKIAGNYLDKIAHFLLFAFMTYQALNSLLQKSETTDVIIWSIVLGFLTEFLQQFIPGRTMDIYDALADTVGVVFAYYFFKYRQLKL